MTFKRKMLILDERDMEKLVFALDLAGAVEKDNASNYKALLNEFETDSQNWRIAKQAEQFARERAEDFKRIAALAMNAEVTETVVEL